MDRESITELLHEVVGPSVRIEDRGDWVMTNCPLAPYTHERGTDSHMSFGIKVEDDDTSFFNCFTCKSKGPIGRLLQDLEDYTGEDYSTLRQLVDDGEFFSVRVPEWDDRKKKRIVLGEPLSDELLDIYDPLFASHPYMRKRHINQVGIDKAQLLLDPDDDNEERIVFPIFDRLGRLYGFSGRAVRDGVEPRVRDYFGLKKKLLMAGSHLVKPEDEFIVLVEGLFDYVALIQYGYVAVASLHSSLTDEQVAILRDIGKPIVIMFDDDMAGRKGKEVVIDTMQQYVPLFEVRYPPMKPENYYKREKCGDPANLRPGALRHMIEKRDLI